MHSTAIFFGVLIFGWGFNGLRFVYLIATIPGINDGPSQSFTDRWGQYIVAAVMLPVPLAVVVGAGALVRWGFLGG